jgi:hypothetical protein
MGTKAKLPVSSYVRRLCCFQSGLRDAIGAQSAGRQAVRWFNLNRPKAAAMPESFFLSELMCPLPTPRPCGKVQNVENLELHSIVVVGPLPPASGGVITARPSEWPSAESKRIWPRHTPVEASFFTAVENSELPQHFRAVFVSQIEEACERLPKKHADVPRA